MGGTIFDCKEDLLTNYIKSNGALNTLKLKQNTVLYNKLANYGKTLGINSIGIIFQHIKQSITEIPQCHCGKITAWSSTKQCYREFCSTKCSSNSPKKKNKILNTCLEKYGVSNPSKLPTVRDKANSTIIEKYGSRDYIQEKVEKTNLEKYGYKSPLSNINIIEKIKKTNLERYGHENASSNKLIQAKARKTNIEKYGGNAPACNAEVLKKMASTTKSKYGADNISTSKIEKEVLYKVNNKYWLVNENITKTLSAIAKETNLTVKTISTRFKKFGLTYIRHRESIFENDVCSFVGSLTSNIVKNSRDILNGLELDLFLPDFNLAIECNGTYWHSELNGKDEFYHLNKTNLCNNKGIHLLHVWEHDWKNKEAIIKSRIQHLLGKSRKIHARKCIIKEIDSITKDNFLLLYCKHGMCESSVNYGLYFEDNLVSVMCFNNYELVRFASLYAVIGGASKLFNRFVKEYNPNKVVANSFKDWDTGNMYKVLGFTHYVDVKPMCLYTINYSKFYDYQINGYDRIWDCGQTTWMWQKTK